MAKRAKKGTTLEFSNMIVRYDPVEDTFSISSKDSDLRGKPFSVTLNNTSRSEETLRELFVEKGVIKKDDFGVSLGRPEYEPSGNVLSVPLGVGYQGQVCWDVSLVPHLLVAGAVGSGSSVLLRSIVKHCRVHEDNVSISLLGDELELSEYKGFAEIHSSAESVIEKLLSVKRLVEDRYEMLADSGVSSFAGLGEGFLEECPPVFVVLKDYKYLLDECVSAGAGELFGSLVKQLLRLGRAANVHVVIFDKFSDELLSDDDLLLNITGRMVVGRASAKHSYRVLGSERASKNSALPVGVGYSNFTSGMAKQSVARVFASYFVKVEDF